MNSFDLIIVAAGVGARLPGVTPKQYILINGRPVLQHTIDAFNAHAALKRICVVIHPDHEELYLSQIKQQEHITYTFGAETRKESVYNGLKTFVNISDEDIILIHDAARPLISQREINNILHVMTTKQAATLATPVSDTLRDDSCNTIPRTGLWAVQTPQAFQYTIIKWAHEQAKSDREYTDDAAMVIEAGTEVEFVTGSRHNIKITYPEDIIVAEKLLSTNLYTEYRTGQGFDVHAFYKDDDSNQQAVDNIRLCGVDIPHNRCLMGHSDADVGLHAVTDAIYGVIGAGDIGMHFPPDNMEFKNMDSAVFLKHATDLLHQNDGRLINVDITIICERPKIGPQRDKIIARLSKLLGIAKNRINIKATTTEQLGFTGRQEGIAAQAVVSAAFQVKESIE